MTFIDSIKNQCHRKSTRKIYYSVWKQFNLFYLLLDYKPKNWEDYLTLFVAHLIQCKKKSTTIKSYISAIKAILAGINICITEDKYLLSSLTCACKLRQDHQVQTRLPIQNDLLNIILNTVKYYYENKSQMFLCKLYRAMFASAYYGLLRVGKITSGTHHIYATNIKIGINKKKIMFILHTSKTNWHDSKPQIVKIMNYRKNGKLMGKSTTIKTNCPYTILREYSACHLTCQHIMEPFFVFSDHSPVTPHHMRHTLQTMLRLSAFNQKLYGTHSLRIGMATDLLNMGFSVETIKKLEHWKSNSIYAYLH